MTAGAFIVGSGRCGSTLLSRALATHPRALSLSEYFTVLGGAAALEWSELDGEAFFRRLTAPSADLIAFMEHAAAIPELLAPRSAAASPLLAIPLPQLSPRPLLLFDELGEFVRALPHAGAHVQHARLFDWLRERLRKRFWVERSGGSAAYVEQLVRRFPRAKFVHLARRGADCAHSMARHPFFRVKVARILARDPALPVAECLARELPFDRFGALWSADMLRVDRVLARVPAERRLQLRYDDLLESPEPVLQTLAEFLDPGADHAAWAAEAARAVRAPAFAVEVTPQLMLACRPGTRVYERMRELGRRSS